MQNFNAPVYTKTKRSTESYAATAAYVTANLERLVELYWEGHRRQDLIRFNKYTGGSYNWSWKGNSVSGIPLDETKSIFPIPSASLAANPNLTQNEGY